MGKGKRQRNKENVGKRKRGVGRTIEDAMNAPVAPTERATSAFREDGRAWVSAKLNHRGTRVEKR